MTPGEQHGGQTEGVSARAFAVSVVLLLLVSVAGLYVELVHFLAYRFAGGVPPIAPLALLFLLAALNPIASKFGRALSRRELLAIYAIVGVGAPLMSHGLLFWWLSASVGQQYFAATIPGWHAVVFAHKPDWFAPTEWRVVEGYVQGYVSVPWSAWFTPLLAWGSFYVALYIAGLCLVLLLKRQWIHHERLTFPIAMVPLETVRERRAGRLPLGGLPVAWMFWIGLAVSAAVSIQDRLPEIFPMLPEIPTFTVLIPWRRVGPLAGLGDLWLVLWPWTIALAYLMPKELSFSVWFFWIVRVSLTVAAIAAGATPQKPEEWMGAVFPAPALQGGGAVLALGAWSLWTARKHLRRVALSGVGRRAQTEGTSAWPLFGFVIAFAYLAAFCWLAGTRVLVGVVLIGLVLTYYIVWARLRAENGMSFIAFPYMVDEMMLGPVGSASYRPAELVTIYGTRWSYFCGWGDTSEVTVGASLDGYKIADSAGLSQRRLTVAMAAGFLVSLLVGAPLLLAACYRYGFVHMHNAVEGWTEMAVRQGATMPFEYLTDPTHPDPAAMTALGAGAAVAVILGLMRLRFWWWPFHPVGYLAANVWGSQWWWQPALIGWLLKTLVIRYGGLRLYQHTVPMAVGVIVGDSLVAFVWPLVELLARGPL